VASWIDSLGAEKLIHEITPMIHENECPFRFQSPTKAEFIRGMAL
jgi:hypothetical protein